MRELTEKEMNLVAGGIARPEEARPSIIDPFPLGSQSPESGGSGGGSSNSDPVIDRMKQASEIAKETCENGVERVESQGASSEVGGEVSTTGGGGSYGSSDGSASFTCK